VDVRDFLRRFGRLACLVLSAILAAGNAAALSDDSAASILARTRVVRVGAVSLHYREKGNGPPVVFVHGSVDDLRNFEPQLDPLSGSYRAIVYSRRYNYPNSQSMRPRNHSALVEAEDLAGLLRGLHATPAHVVGHSYGAYTALLLALNHPELVRSLTLAEPPILRWLPDLTGGRPPYDDFMKMWTQVGGQFRKGNREQAMRVTTDWFGKNGDRIDGKAATFDTLDPGTRQAMMANSLEWEALTTSADAFPAIDRAAVKSLRSPVLLMSGEDSLAMLKQIDGELRRLLPSADVAVIAGASHEMWAERPDECRARVMAFFAKH
jgi:non-heme chloroperoxidase